MTCTHNKHVPVPERGRTSGHLYADVGQEGEKRILKISVMNGLGEVSCIYKDVCSVVVNLVKVRAGDRRGHDGD